jgi:hypothetical protein
MPKSFLRLRQGYAKSQVMPTNPSDPSPPASPAAHGSGADAPGRALPDAARRALAEAAARRRERGSDSATTKLSKELEGRGGLDPTRYGDWEVNGLASDF